MGTFSDTVANSWLDALARNTSYANATVYVKLHLGDPGSAGTTTPGGRDDQAAGDVRLGRRLEGDLEHGRDRVDERLDERDLYLGLTVDGLIRRDVPGER